MYQQPGRSRVKSRGQTGVAALSVVPIGTYFKMSPLNEKRMQSVLAEFEKLRHEKNFYKEVNKFIRLTS